MTIHTIPLMPTASSTLSLRRELDRIFDDVFVNRPATAWQPTADAREDSTGFTLTLDVPGVSPDSVEVLAEDSTLTVKGTRPATTLAEGERTLFAERSQGAFLRRFRLPKAPIRRPSRRRTRTASCRSASGSWRRRSRGACR